MIRKLRRTDDLLYHYDDYGNKIIGMNDKMNGDSQRLWCDCSGLTGDCTFIHGNCSGLKGNVTSIYGDCSLLIGDLDKCEITEKERKAQVNIVDLIEKNDKNNDI